MKQALLDESLKNFHVWVESSEGEAYFANIRKEQEIERLRLDRVERYLETCNIKTLLDRLAAEHNDAYRERAYKRGYEPSPNHKFMLLWNYVSKRLDHVDNERIPQDFLGGSFFFKGHWFLVYVGQGCFYRVLDYELNELMTI